jgi:pilus assembly protein Flp/PilA
VIVGPTTTELDAPMSKLLTMRSFRDFVRDDSGATAIEYALIASGVAGAIIVVVMATGTSLQAMYQKVSDSLK